MHFLRVDSVNADFIMACGSVTKEGILDVHQMRVVAKISKRWPRIDGFETIGGQKLADLKRYFYENSLN